MTQHHARLHTGIVQAGLATEASAPLRLDFQPEAPGALVFRPQPCHIVAAADWIVSQVQAECRQCGAHLGIWLSLCAVVVVMGINIEQLASREQPGQLNQFFSRASTSRR